MKIFFDKSINFLRKSVANHFCQLIWLVFMVKRIFN